MDSRSPKVKLATLWERQSRDGRQYFTGYLGSCKVLIFKDDCSELPEGAVAVWDVYLEQAPPRQKAAQGAHRMPRRGAGAPDRRPVSAELPLAQPAGAGGQRINVKRQKREPEPVATRPFDDDVPF